MILVRYALNLLEYNTSIRVPKSFDFWLTARGSGWSVLTPFSIDEEERTLSRVLRLESGGGVRRTVWAGEGRDPPAREIWKEHL